MPIYIPGRRWIRTVDPPNVKRPVMRVSSTRWQPRPASPGLDQHRTARRFEAPHLAARRAGMNYRSPMISGRQIRAARALVGWKQRELAAAAGISEISIKNAERGLVDSRGSTLNAIQQAFDRAG